MQRICHQPIQNRRCFRVEDSIESGHHPSSSVIIRHHPSSSALLRRYPSSFHHPWWVAVLLLIIITQCSCMSHTHSPNTVPTTSDHTWPLDAVTARIFPSACRSGNMEPLSHASWGAAKRAQSLGRWLHLCYAVVRCFKPLAPFKPQYIQCFPMSSRICNELSLLDFSCLQHCRPRTDLVSTGESCRISQDSM